MRMRTIEMIDGVVKLIDQRQLPHRLEIVECRDYRTLAEAIRDMTIRGAPAIGAAAAFGLALAARASHATTRDDLLRDLEAAATILRATRPTAVNLMWALDRVLNKARAANLDGDGLRELVIAEAQRIAEEDVETNRAMARYGAALIDDGDGVLTHCNAGALATVDVGTALGCIIEAHRQGKRIHVFVDETRPRLQGARLTAWELMQNGVPMTLIADNAAGFYMRKGKIQKCFVGSDRVAANGDVANKIGTYKIAVVARENGIPFYAVMPTSTIDMTLPNGDLIPIEERDAREVTHIEGVPIAPEGVNVGNPAFDVTPHKYITALVTERGVVYPPFAENLTRIMFEETQ
ncbi:MAG: S-methyl-5-thioribose-1-phosphate isomerase [Anaerolineae bacterium]|nr:S-methyl-5-thioribose-1-phosphate isomerase [Anaerolineae bacterium]